MSCIICYAEVVYTQPRGATHFGGADMSITKEALKTLIVDYKFLGRSNQSLEDNFKLMLKHRLIDVDDYSNAMEIIYDE